MNLIYAATCLSIVSYLGYMFTLSRRNQQRADYFVGLLDKMLPKAFPQMFAPEISPEAQAELSAATMMNEGMLAGQEVKMREYSLRTELELLTLEVLRGVCFSINYDAAYAKAEELLLAKVAHIDRPLSPQVLAILGEQGTVPPPAQSAEMETVVH